jgi:hypothetical protein
LGLAKVAGRVEKVRWNWLEKVRWSVVRVRVRVRKSTLDLVRVRLGLGLEKVRWS